jgi:hypothetical protein
MSQASERAAFVRALPHVQRWIKRFRKIAQEMPEVWVYVASSRVNVMANDHKMRPIERLQGDGMDQDASVDSVIGGHWDGGDW